MTSIPDDAIGVEWTEPLPSYVDPSSSMLQSDGSYQMPWSAVIDDPSDTVSLTVKDQYGLTRNINRNATITQIAGTGDITGGDTKYCANTVTFTYQRNQLAAPEIHPFFRVDFVDYPALTYVFSITLLDSGGDPI